MSAVFGIHAARGVARCRRRPRVSSWRLQGPKSMTHAMPSPQRWRSSAISKPCSTASFASRACARLDPRRVTSFVPNLCLATLTSCSSAPSRASPRSSIDPAHSRSRHPVRQVVDDAPPTRAPAARREGANLLVAALDDQPPGFAGESSDRPLVSVCSAGCQELLPRPRVCVDAEGPPSLDRRPKSALGSLFLERQHLVQLVFLAPRDGHRRNRVMPHLEMSPMRSSGCADLGRQRLAPLVSPSPCRAERILVLAPKSVVT